MDSLLKLPNNRIPLPASQHLAMNAARLFKNAVQGQIKQFYMFKIAALLCIYTTMA